MSGRVLFAGVLVAAAWTTAITGITLAGAAKAEAAWLKTGAGTAFARALTLTAPGSFAVTPVKCNGSNQQVSMTWSAVPNATSYEVYATAPNGSNGQVLTTTTGTTLANYNLPYKPAVITVRGLDNNWRGPASAPATGCP
jgi:hypothetical protein